MNLYVGNISSESSEFQIRKLFERFGKIDKISINKPPVNKDAYCFCFISMPFETQALRAIKELNGTSVKGNTIVVNESALGVPYPDIK